MGVKDLFVKGTGVRSHACTCPGYTRAEIQHIPPRFVILPLTVRPTASPGLVTRIIMIGTLTGLQWWIYGSFKNAMGFGTS